MQNIISTSLELIKKSVESSKNPAVLCSFGKDSIVLLHLARQIMSDIPVIYFREPFFPKKSRFANEMIEKWNLVAYDFPPFNIHTLQKDDSFEVIKLYSVGADDFIFMPFGIEKYKEGEKFFCSKHDLLERPTGRLNEFKWDTLFIGHKSVDTNPLLGDIPLVKDTAQFEVTKFCYPLRHWTNNDIWQYIRENDVPYNVDRYQEDNSEHPDHVYSEDYCAACFKCLDYNEPARVLCPKTNQIIDNVSSSREENAHNMRLYEDKFTHSKIAGSLS